ncbi:MAG: sigma 54-interacting transcriptional regulator [Syntrophobacteraceae bacterium]|nr:sigma 54-interacting transcriptional regulator [Syntrophobacteraceae bacterium]
MDNLCEVKLNIFSAMHRMLDRMLYLEPSVGGLMGGLSQAVPHSRVAVVLNDGAEIRFFFTHSPEDDSQSAIAQRVRALYKTGFDLVLRIPQPFVVLGESPGPLFLDPKALHSIRKEQVRLLGAPIVAGEEVAGAILVDRFFSDRVPILEDLQLLSMVAVFIGRILGLQSQVKRREEALVMENQALRAKISEESLGLVCLGQSEAAGRLEAAIRKAAPSDAPLHILGEAGTGKSSIARLIHELSGRSRFPFIRVHCSLPEELLEKELFSSGNGFLNGCTEEFHAPPILSTRMAGAFERAAGGTLLLDEVGDLSAAHQAKLLDMLDGMQTGSFGIAGPQGIATRLISVSSMDLGAVRANALRKDLLNRLATLRIPVPPIRERKEDIPLLIAHFIDHECRKLGRKTRVGPRMLKRLCEHDWPGNITEIKNTVIRLAIMAEGPEIGAEDIESVLRSQTTRFAATDGAQTLSPWSRLDKIEIKEVSAALERNKWIRRKAADELGLTFRQMNYRVKKFGLDALIKENRRLK